MTEETLYWILSTLPQVIAALTGLLLTATTFVYQNLDKNESDISYDNSVEIIEGTKTEIHNSTIRLLIVSIVSIIYDISWLAFTPWLSQKISWFQLLGIDYQLAIIVFWIVLIIINLSALLLLINLLRKILDPQFRKKIVDKMSKKEKDNNIKEISEKENEIVNSTSQDEESDKNPVSVSPEILIKYFVEFERIVRQYDLYPPDSSHHPVPLRVHIRKLAEERILPKRYLRDIDKIIKLRNLYLHGGDIGNVSKELVDKLIEVTNLLKAALPAYRKHHHSTKMEDVFLRWIDENVENLKDAYELLHAVMFPNTMYGQYYVTEVHDVKYISSNSNPETLRIYDKKAEILFKSLLQNKFSKNGESIEELYEFNNALDKS